MTQQISDSGVLYGNSAAAQALYSVNASVASNAITVTLDPCTIAFRSTTLTTGTPVPLQVAAQISLVIAATDSFAAVTAGGTQRIAILAINNAGVVELAAANLAGGAALDETGVITTATTATTATAIKAAAVRTGVAYKVVGFIDVPFTTAVGYGALVKAQGCGGQALAAMSSLGYGQIEQDVTGSRSSATWYYNNTGRPITVYIQTQTTAQVGAIVYLGSPASNVSWTMNAFTNNPAVFAFVVSPGRGYRCDCTNGFTKWIEGR